MKDIKLQDLRVNLSKKLSDLPLRITKRGKTIAYIVKSVEDLNKSRLAASASMFCPIHNRMKTGDTYQCGCQVID